MPPDPKTVFLDFLMAYGGKSGCSSVGDVIKRRIKGFRRVQGSRSWQSESVIECIKKT